MRVQLPVERTKSRTGLHSKVSAVILIRGERVQVITEPKTPAKGTYSRGVAGLVEVEVLPGDLVVHASLVMNPRKRVKGTFKVIGPDGSAKLVVNYRKLKLRVSSGDKSLMWAVLKAVEALGLAGYVRRRAHG